MATPKKVVKAPLKPQGSLGRDQIIAQRLKSRGHDVDNIQMGDNFDIPVFVPIGIPEIDAALLSKHGCGVPNGTILELCGPSQSGKTFVAYKHLAEHQKLGRRVAFMDVENTFYEPRAAEIGVDVHDANTFELYRNMGTAEAWGDWILDCAATGEYGAIAIDSIKAMMPSREFQKEMGEGRQTFAHPVFIRDFLTKMLVHVSRFNMTLIIVNHQVTKSGGMPNTFVTGAASGSGVEYLTSQRLWIRKINGAQGGVIGLVNGENQRIGGRSVALVHKTRFGVPEQTVEFPILFGKYQSNPLAEFVYRATSHKEEPIKRSGSKPNYIYRFINSNTGEIMVEASNDFDIIDQLLKSPPPSKLPRGNKSENAFDFVASKIRLAPDQKDVILEKMAAIRSGEFAYTPMDGDNPYESVEGDTTDDETDEED